MLSGLFAESRALGKSASLPRAWWSALGKYASLPRAWWSALGKPIFFFEHHLCRKSFFFNNSLPTVALGKEAVTPLAVVWPLLGRASLPRARVCREP